RRARGRASAPTPGSTCRAPSPTARRDSPCSRRLSSSLSRRRFLVCCYLGRVAPSAGGFGALDPRERAFALDDPKRPLASLLADELVEGTRLADVRRDVRRNRDRHLPVLGEADRELRLLDRLDDSLGLRDELGLAKPAGRLGGLDEPLCVLRPHVSVDAFLDGLGTQLRDRVARVDALRAALIAEVAARAVPDAVLVVVVLEPLHRRLVARVADKPETLRERRRPKEFRIGLHRIALRDAAAAHDAERLLVDHVYLLL